MDEIIPDIEFVEKVNRGAEKRKKDKLFSAPVIGLLIVISGFMAINFFQMNSVTAMVSYGGLSKVSASNFGKELANIDIDSLKSTGYTLAAVFPVDEIQNADDAMRIMFPTGTPIYGDDLGVSYDDPVVSLATLAKMYNTLKTEVKSSNPEAWQRFLNMATKPVGISCEYCCGVGPSGIDSNGNSICGCQHNPALLSIALYLTAYTDFSDGEILYEIMRWKTLFFPKNMIELGLSLAGGDTSSLDSTLPGMVGGC